MKLTKFQHACFTAEKDGSTLVVDPGTFSHDFIIPRTVTGIIITHEHPDHYDPEVVKAILSAHPKATVIGHESITLKHTASPTLAVSPGQSYQIGSFSLRFYGGQHAPIAEGIETPPNYAVLIDESLYYPGDSFTVPEVAAGTIKTLALPVSAPWLNFAQVRDFLAAIHPTLAFPTHDGILSEDGKQLLETLAGGYAQKQGIIYKRLDGQSIEVS